MKRVTTEAIYDIESGVLLSWEGYWIDEQVVPFQQLKKGRETMEANAAAGQAAQKQQQANSQAQYGTATKLENEAIGNTTPGSLSPAATAQLAADSANIGRVYNGMRQTAFATLGQRGMGNAPSGFQVAANNGLNVGQEGAETGAFRNAQVQTQAQRNNAMHTAAGLSGQEGGLATGNLNASEHAAVDRNQAGSTMGDVMGGIAAMAPVIAAPFTGGASLAGMAGMPSGSKLWGKIGSPSGVGGYAGQGAPGTNPGG